MSIHEQGRSPGDGALAALRTAALTLLARPALLDLLPVAVYACDAEGRILWFNSRAVELWGRVPRVGDDAELFCGSFRLHRFGRPIAHSECPMAEVIRTGVPLAEAEAEIERTDGTRVWVAVHIDPILDSGGRLVGAINCFHETTELHQAHEALRARQQDLEDFFENGAVALHVVGADGTILQANQAELDLLGYTREEYLGMNVSEIHADSEALKDILRRLARGETLENHPARLRAKDGSLRHVQITSNGRFRDGAFKSTRCFTVDVTERRQAEQRLAESEARLRQVLDALPAAIYTTDAEGRITYYNRAAVELSGREPEIGSDSWCVTWRLFTPDGAPLPHDQCPMAVALKEGRTIRNAEAIAERPDGTRFPFIPYPTPIRDASGAVTGAINMLVDVSQRKEAETQQRVLLDELNHRVKNNMQMLHSLLMSARRETRSLDARAELGDAGQRIAAMAAAQQIMYRSGSPNGFECREFIEAVCHAARQPFGRDIAIACEADTGNLPNDVAMPLALILNELLTNALKHGISPRQGGRIRVRLGQDGEDWVLSVEDDGPGFDLTPGSRRSSGLGLVLGLARQIKGELRVDRNPGARCSVRFRR